VQKHIDETLKMDCQTMNRQHMSDKTAEHPNYRLDECVPLNRKYLKEATGFNIGEKAHITQTLNQQL